MVTRGIIISIAMLVFGLSDRKKYGEVWLLCRIKVQLYTSGPGEYCQRLLSRALPEGVIILVMNPVENLLL